jgi:predicted dehydrogenase
MKNSLLKHKIRDLPKTKYSVGILGAGGIVENLHLPVLLSRSDVQIAWIADKNDSRALEMAKAFGIPHVTLPANPNDLPLTDVLLIAAPYGARRNYYESLKGRRVHLYVEKPFARSVAEHKQYLSHFPLTQIACGFQRRSWRSFADFNAVVKDGLFGAVRRVRVAHGHRGRLGGGRYGGKLAIAGGGILFEAGIHLLDLALCALEASDILDASGHQIREDGFDVHTDARLCVRTRALGDIPIDVLVSGLVNTDHGIFIEYDSVVLSFDESIGSMWIRAKHASKAYPLCFAMRGPEPSLQQCDAHWSEFLNGIRTGKSNRTSASDSLVTTKAIERLYDLPERDI